MAELDQVAVGEVVEHHLLPGHGMPVLEVKPCEVDANRSALHSQYKVVDPEGVEDWLCAYGVRRVSGA